ncbi:MAG: PilZ domain-containing protein [Actinobacteria bacterium]|nr:PilZ domain-containing protein [Actinomycetota bacterium]
MAKNLGQHVRVALGTPASCALLDPSGSSDRSLDVTLVDLSAGGALITAGEALLAGRPLRLAIRSTDPPIDLAVIGTVVRAETRATDGAFRAGIRFTVGDPERVALTRFVLKAARTTGQGSTLVLPAAGAAA